ncbi:hypothetical protein SUDANB176_07114 [Streptomyces sp. enrichment culture]|uniref:ATP-binding protein n=1 Tax=Streptomyces sp. enrichment culture TaxID=1795815 RepID=UPI003F543335
MSSPAHPVLRPSAGTAVRAGGPGTAAAPPDGPPTAVPYGEPHPTPETAGAATHAAPRCAGTPDVRPGLRPEPAHPPLAVSAPDDHPPVHVPGAGSAPEEHGPRPCIADALREAWVLPPTPSAGRTVRTRSSAHPPT